MSTFAPVLLGPTVELFSELAGDAALANGAGCVTLLLAARGVSVTRPPAPPIRSQEIAHACQPLGDPAWCVADVSLVPSLLLLRSRGSPYSTRLGGPTTPEGQSKRGMPGNWHKSVTVGKAGKIRTVVALVRWLYPYKELGDRYRAGGAAHLPVEKCLKRTGSCPSVSPAPPAPSGALIYGRSRT